MEKSPMVHIAELKKNYIALEPSKQVVRCWLLEQRNPCLFDACLSWLLLNCELTTEVSNIWGIQKASLQGPVWIVWCLYRNDFTPETLHKLLGFFEGSSSALTFFTKSYLRRLLLWHMWNNLAHRATDLLGKLTPFQPNSAHLVKEQAGKHTYNLIPKLS